MFDENKKKTVTKPRDSVLCAQETERERKIGRETEAER